LLCSIITSSFRSSLSANALNGELLFLRVVDACYTWYEFFGWVYTMSKAVLETGTHCALFLTCWVVVTGGVHRRAKPTRYYKT
jgi:hypothetical protein